MRWNWQQPDWPRFTWRSSRLTRAEERFLLGSGVFVGSFDHLAAADRDRLTVEVMSEEAVTTSRIEGELLDRDSVQSSIRRQLGLGADGRRVRPGEQGISAVMIELYRRFSKPLDRETLLAWHR